MSRQKYVLQLTSAERQELELVVGAREVCGVEDSTCECVAQVRSVGRWSGVDGRADCGSLRYDDPEPGKLAEDGRGTRTAPSLGTSATHGRTNRIQARS